MGGTFVGSTLSSQFAPQKNISFTAVEMTEMGNESIFSKSSPEKITFGYLDPVVHNIWYK